jgi:hypothetical protein
MAREPKIMESTKEGTCLKCLAPIAIGEQIAYTKEFGAMHVTCPEDPQVEESYGYINIGGHEQPEWAIRVIRPQGDAASLEGEEVQIITSRGNSRTEVLGKLAQLFEERHAVYRKGKPVPNDDPVTEVGVYETPDGEIFIVKQFTDRETGREVTYARQLVEINPERANEAGGRVNIEFEKAPGAIYRLKAAWKMDLERAKELTIRYGRCLVCGRRLKAAKSVEEGIGPVCLKSFRGRQMAMSFTKESEPSELTVKPEPSEREQQIADLEAQIARLKEQS